MSDLSNNYFNDYNKIDNNKNVSNENILINKYNNIKDIYNNNNNNNLCNNILLSKNIKVLINNIKNKINNNYNDYENTNNNKCSTENNFFNNQYKTTVNFLLNHLNDVKEDICLINYQTYIQKTLITFLFYVINDYIYSPSVYNKLIIKSIKKLIISPNITKYFIPNTNIQLNLYNLNNYADTYLKLNI